MKKYEYLKEVFSENNVSRSTVRRKIIENKVIEYKCIICGNNGEWNGKKITLELHHRDGNNKNNKIENLDFMCQIGRAHV